MEAFPGRAAETAGFDTRNGLNKANATRNYRQFSILRWKGYHCVQSNKDLNKNLTWTGSWQEDGSTEAEKKKQWVATCPATPFDASLFFAFCPLSIHAP